MHYVRNFLENIVNLKIYGLVKENYKPLIIQMELS